MRINYASKIFLFTAVLLGIFSINIYAVDSENVSNSTKKILIAEQANSEKNKTAEGNDNKIKQSEVKTSSDKEKTYLKTTPVQFCQGKYKKMSSTGFEFITVQCPSVENTCTCDLDIKGFREWVECGGKRKPSSKGSDFIDCRSFIVGN